MGRINGEQDISSIKHGKTCEHKIKIRECVNLRCEGIQLHKVLIKHAISAGLVARILSQSPSSFTKPQGEFEHGLIVGCIHYTAARLQCIMIATVGRKCSRDTTEMLIHLSIIFISTELRTL